MESRLTASNADPAVVDGFGDEWSRFDQSDLAPAERQQIFDDYFRIFPWADLPSEAVGFDLGCGSGRWAKVVAPRVGQLHCIDASATALEVARRALADVPNVCLHHASVDRIPLREGTADFGYSLGVLHHVPDTLEGLRRCVEKLRPGAPFLVYLYYRFDDKPLWFRALWRASDLIRRVVSRLPHALRYVVSQVLALFVYWPLARAARVAERLGLAADGLPLAYYRDKSFYTMRTDALDRFGTRLEQRFTRPEIQTMMEQAGLERISFSDRMPFWCAIGYKSSRGG